jgi:hypothetical protein
MSLPEQIKLRRLPNVEPNITGGWTGWVGDVDVWLCHAALSEVLSVTDEARRMVVEIDTCNRGEGWTQVDYSPGYDDVEPTLAGVVCDPSVEEVLGGEPVSLWVRVAEVTCG